MTAAINALAKPAWAGRHPGMALLIAGTDVVERRVLECRALSQDGCRSRRGGQQVVGRYDHTEGE